MIIFLYGQDTFRSREHLKKMIAKFRADRDPQGYNVTRLDALAESEPSRIMNELLASPFLAERRLVVIESLLASKHKALQIEILERLESKKLPESTVAVFWERTDAWKAKEAAALFDRLIKEKYSQQFAELKGAKFTSWIAAEAKERGGDIAAEAIQFIAAHAGGDTWQASSLLDQLLAYKNLQPVTLADVQLFLEEKADSNIFALVDAIVSRQSKKVYAMIQAQYRVGEDVQFIFAMLLRQWRILLQLRDLFERGESLSSDAMAKKLSLHPFVVKKTLPLIKRYGLPELSRSYHDLLELDVQIKTGQGTPELLLDIFVGKLGVG